MIALTDKQYRTIVEYIKTVDPMTGKGNISEASRKADTLSASNAQKLISRKDIDQLLEAVMIKEYKQTLKLNDLDKTDLEKKLEIMASGYIERLNPLTGSFELEKIPVAQVLKATAQLADLRGWKGAKTVNHTHDITGFLNKVSNKSFQLPSKNNVIDVDQLN